MISWTLSIGILAFLPVQVPAGQAGIFDLDGDERITRTEFIAGRSARFEALDHNHDQVISSADFQGGNDATLLGMRVDRVITSADLDRDGMVTRLELGLSGTPLFDRADIDGNGIVERQEIARFKAQLGAVKARAGQPVPAKGSAPQKP